MQVADITMIYIYIYIYIFIYIYIIYFAHVMHKQQCKNNINKKCYHKTHSKEKRNKSRHRLNEIRKIIELFTSTVVKKEVGRQTEPSRRKHNSHTNLAMIFLSSGRLDITLL